MIEIAIRKILTLVNNLVPRVLSYPPAELPRASRIEPWERG